MSWKSILWFCAVGLAVWPGTGEAATPERLRHENALRIAYRQDAPPFSYQDANGKPTGFVINLCLAVAKRVSEQINLLSLP